MALELGNILVNAAKLGSDTVTKMYLGADLIFGGSGPGPDPDAQLFITTAGIVDPTQQSAINQLVIDMKAAGVWSKVLACYPFVGANNVRDNFKYNLKNPSQYVLPLSGAPDTNCEVDPTGLLIVQAINTGIVLAGTGLTTLHMAIDVTSPFSWSNGYDVGIGPDGQGSGDVAIILSYGNDTQYYADGAGGYLTMPNTTFNGWFGGRSPGTGNRYLDRNGVPIAYQVSDPPIMSTLSLPIGGLNFNGAILTEARRRYRFATFGEYLTDAELLAYYNAVQTFNTTVGR